ncbi:MAG TPA: bifunctional proline dehydrogenase/L-glutamate gamma-semialdehyde dehydrogenase PutA [Verrucomicrobiae bacterium]|nr:bifunctional proline dehydrogenase/L-glutamate gamma-semialdehyde dehydrogenase PutA [Verrucomicrobiae bacterium]
MRAMKKTDSAAASAQSPWLLAGGLPARDKARAAISAAWLADETATVRALIAAAELPRAQAEQVQQVAAGWVQRVRKLRDKESPLDAFMREYDLSSEEGVLLMCLAEALLRIPDDATAEKLIADKLSEADWEGHLGQSDSLFVNASTWGLMLTGRIVRLSPSTTGNFRKAMGKLVGKSSEPVIRLAIRQAMRLMGHQFVMGRTIGEAMGNARSKEQKRYLHSYDMLGEAALTAADAQRYLAAYHDAIRVIGAKAPVPANVPVMQRPGISVKLSALHPRYEFAKRERVLAELTPVLLELARAAKGQNIGMTVDAEEADRLELSLDLFEAVYRDPSLSGWEGFGLAVQAFQRRAVPVIEWLELLARGARRRIPVRLVKGAYWDTEVKRAQEQGLPDYPVFTRKAATDVSYLACARRLLAARDVFYPQFATHNAHTAAAVREYAGPGNGYEFQRLHGMGEALYQVVGEDLGEIPCRVYSPVGSHEDLLPYLVRRLLENGANTSFVNRIFDDAVPPEQLVADPVAAMAATTPVPSHSLPTPAALYGPKRRNSTGLNFASEAELASLRDALVRADAQPPTSVASLVAAKQRGKTVAPARDVMDPADRRRIVGHWQPLDPALVPAVVGAAVKAQPQWNAQPVKTRAQFLDTAADLLEQRRADYLYLLVREAGKTLPDANAEVREAVDFLRYYAAQARDHLATPAPMPGPTGEHNELQLHGRGTFVCISPWNFPLAIFAGQVAAALVAGNCVIAKPAEQTNLVAARLVALLHEAGVPAEVLQCVLGEGDVGAALVRDPRIAGVAFTGSGEVARLINRALAARDGPIATLIAETGGQNAMIVDSSALPEQVVKDTIASSFNAAGQRCSALRVLFLQDEIADKVIGMLQGAMQELVVGDPALLSTDVGPVIDLDAQRRLEQHASQILAKGRSIGRLEAPADARHGTFFPPCAVEIDSLDQLEAEHFGAMLHVIRYPSKKLDAVIDAINASGFGLTLGVHSRIESTWRKVQARARVGNCYVNRNMIGAVVGVQPFGGEGLSGTGPKAGGPHYLLRFVTERTLTVNTAAVGGNARLLAGA